jgi:hypothetical protein
MNISRAFRSLSFRKLEKCNPKPGYDDSCVPCKNCSKSRVKYEDGQTPESCGNPTDLTVVDVTYNYVDLSWTGVVGATNYIVKYRQLPSGPWLSFSNWTPATTANIAVNPESIYEWKVEAVCGDIVGEYVNGPTFETDPTPPPIDCCSEDYINAYNPAFGNIENPTNSYAFYLSTDTIPAECCYDYDIRFDHSDGVFDGLVEVNNNLINENEWVLLEGICQSSEIFIKYNNDSKQTINFHLKNKTCNHNYGTIGTITVNS